MSTMAKNLTTFILTVGILCFFFYGSVSGTSSTASTDDDWKDEIRVKLVKSFSQEDPVGLVHALHFLDTEDNPPAWRTLKSCLEEPVVFKKYARMLMKDAGRGEKDGDFRKILNIIYEKMMTPTLDKIDGTSFQGFNMTKLLDANTMQVSGFLGFVQSWSQLSKSTQRQILELIPLIVGDTKLIPVSKIASETVNHLGGKLATNTLAGVYLTFDTMKHLYQWWNGDITGKRCVKSIIDSTFTMGAGYIGGAVGVSAGFAVGGPIGAAAGGLICGALSSSATSFIIDRLTQSLFGLPKDVALENAYNYLGVSMTASNDEVNQAYRYLSLKHHPDKGGKTEDFHIVQIHMGVIKIARGQEDFEW